MSIRRKAASGLIGLVLLGIVSAAPSLQAQAAPGNSPLATLAEYNQIQPGMSYQQVVDIIGGPGSEMASNQIAGIRTVMYMWQGVGVPGANMNAMFQNDKLVQKAQAGLR